MKKGENRRNKKKCRVYRDINIIEKKEGKEKKD